MKVSKTNGEMKSSSKLSCRVVNILTANIALNAVTRKLGKNDSITPFHIRVFNSPLIISLIELQSVVTL